jgi:hypothetical protein
MKILLISATFTMAEQISVPLTVTIRLNDDDITSPIPLNTIHPINVVCKAQDVIRIHWPDDTSSPTTVSLSSVMGTHTATSHDPTPGSTTTVNINYSVVSDDTFEPLPFEPPPPNTGIAVGDRGITCEFPIQRPPWYTLKTLLQNVAASHHMDVAHFEVFMLEPTVLIATGTTKSLGEAARVLQGMTIPQLQALPLRNYIDETIRLNLLSGSCGGTSQILDAFVADSDKKTGEVKPEEIKPEAFKDVVKRAIESSPCRWYCRVRRNPHSFLIEYLPDGLRIYQSYFGKYTLASHIANMRVFTQDEFCSLWDSSMNGDRSASVTLFSAEPHWHSTMIYYELNLNPASEDEVRSRIHILIETKAKEWAQILDTPIKHLLVAEPDQDTQKEPAELRLQDYSLDFDIETPEVGRQYRWDGVQGDVMYTYSGVDSNGCHIFRLFKS